MYAHLSLSLSLYIYVYIYRERERERERERRGLRVLGSQPGPLQLQDGGLLQVAELLQIGFEILWKEAALYHGSCIR